MRTRYYKSYSNYKNTNTSFFLFGNNEESREALLYRSINWLDSILNINNICNSLISSLNCFIKYFIKNKKKIYKKILNSIF